MERPNVVLVITDDQGYGDLGCTGNPWIKTPNIDRFHEEALRFGDFHVSPLCTPTRGGIMSGRRPIRNGAWATCWGRSILRRDQVTLADVFRDSGYRTGMFGKWHLGDNYPYRPQDRGFEHVVAHKGGGVGQTPDFWGNNYFDDTYFHNGEPVEHEGYCTDVWFEEGMKFIEANKDEPFFAFISTNAPHSPYLVAERYRALYEGNEEIPEPAFYGMITNIDENFGRLRKKLEELGLQENTILIFMTDNGSSGGWRENSRQGYNAGMRGTKGSYYDGGHRVPFFIRYPEGEIGGGRDIDEMVLDIDLLPTFIDLCGLKRPEGAQFDGMSAAGLLDGSCGGMPDRVHFLQIRQDTAPPEKWTNAVMTRRWRLVFGKELYDIEADPGQERDVAEEHPEVVEKLRKAHEEWWDEVAPSMEDYCPISLGNEKENPTRLNAMDVMGDVSWNQCHIMRAKESTGRWCVEVEEDGLYRFSLRRWPDELDLPMDGEPLPEDQRVAPYEKEMQYGALHPRKARLKIFGREEVVDVAPRDKESCFELELTRGVTTLDAWFIDEEGEEQGAFYVTVERLSYGG